MTKKTAPRPAKKASAKQAKPKPAKTPVKKPSKATEKSPEKRLGALDAAIQVLKASKSPMTCVELIEAMSTQGLWTSPGGKTPANTLHAALMKEINTKGAESRFVKTERGRFAAKFAS